ncbi:MAG: SLBB domain-containing protein, partial [Bacteroidetes bacterium]|nr:SLBB domain-containing protein [Bacteroidota bacterium]
RTAVTNPDFQPSLRNIQLVHTDGTEESVDLLHYFSTGETSHNPFLRDGDVIFVPAFDPAFSSIYIDGAVPFPGPYDYRDGDTLSDLLAVAGGFDADASVDNVRVLRTLPNGDTEQHEFTKEEALTPRTGSFKLHARDHVSIARTPNILGSATVDGMVNHPGTYPIVDKQTALKDLIELAGGLRPDALLRGAFLIRRSLPQARRSVSGGRFESPIEGLRRRLAADTTEIMQRLRLTDLDFLSRAYFAQELRLQNRVSLDLEKSLEDSSEPVLMRDGDRLVIPRDENTIYVFGQVTRPGFVSFTAGRTAEEYIETVGGRGQFASKLYIVHPATGAFTTVGSRILQSGDLIFIDRALDVADSPELQRLITEQERTRADARIRTMQTVLQSVATVATVVALIISLRRN